MELVKFNNDTYRSLSNDTITSSKSIYQTSGTPYINFFPVLQRFYLSGLPTATLQVNLLNDDTYQLNCVTSSYVQIEIRCALNMEILDLLNEESVSGVHSGRASL